MHRADGSVKIEQKRQNLRQNNAVVGINRYALAGLQIADQGCFAIARCCVQHIRGGHTIVTEAARVARLADLQHPATNILPTAIKKSVNVITVNRRAAIRPERTG